MEFTITLAIVSSICSLVCAYIGFKIGRTYERVEWNNLIKEGRIPAIWPN